MASSDCCVMIPNKLMLIREHSEIGCLCPSSATADSSNQRCSVPPATAAAPKVVPSQRFFAKQFVKCRISPSKWEIGVVELVDDAASDEPCYSVVTRSGFRMRVRGGGTVVGRSLQRAFLVVLDLNGVLLYREGKQLFPRPHVEEFLRFIMSNFVVAVWTSSEERNAVPIIESLFGHWKERLLFQWYRSRCTMCPTEEKPYATRKDLQKIFDEWPESFHAVNTIIVDDSREKCSHPDNALCPLPFLQRNDSDEGLLDTIRTLQLVLEEDSLRPLQLDHAQAM